MTTQKSETKQRVNAALAKQKEALTAFMGRVERREATWQSLLPDGQRANWFIGEVRVAVARSQKLLECDEVSVFDALTTCAQLGLSPSGRLGSAYLIPFYGKNGYKCQLVIGYRGYVDLAFRSGDVAAFHAVAVHATDAFTYRDGLSPVLEHTPSEDVDPGPLRAVYALARMRDGSHGFCVMFRREVEPIKAAALAKKRQGAPPTPWETAEAEMWKKTAVRRLIKLLPLSPTRAKDLFQAEDAEREQEEAMDVAFSVSTEDEPTSTTEKAKAALKARNTETLEASSEPTDEEKAAIRAAEEAST
jgi:recombination protein RecT